MGARGVFDAMALLAAVEQAAPAEAVDVLAARLREDLGVLAASFLIADYASNVLARFSGPRVGGPVMQTVPVAGTVAGRVLRTQRPVVDRDRDRVVIVVPVTARGEAIGVIEVAVAATDAGAAAVADGTVTADSSDGLVAEISRAAHQFAYAVVLNRRYTDLFEWGRRSVPFDLAAEIQRRLLPDSFTCECAQATVAGWLEPAASIAGDTFDYAFGQTDLYLSLTDAMGHGLSAAVLATLMVNSLRNVRREHDRQHLAAMADHANAMMAAHSGPEQFVTGLPFHIDLPTGTLTAVNAGHVPFYLLRDGAVEQISWPPDPAFGMFAAQTYTVRHLQLHPGDRLLLVTDGMTERAAAQIDLPAQLAANRQLHPREFVQNLTRLVLAACDGNIKDDATVMCLDWHQGTGPVRRSGSGADLDRASAPDQ
ncbi:serine/threonine-protein phosphatase [Frankia sp. AgB1.9]|uniref:PP2C family protein-serine/threonine phosphatase n=1 Tax=unclassified Frankia TaxID=2632575 RepID=UPI0019314B3C|nr:MULTISPECIES: PP2C family protein-serine/threonine phosphatase [unclassified Frankia]MBL7491926.1 serine/threonine-protein phosphatase [Frankia sp. AgW1.1]MBL7550215.1 serine/threonine-protein phosphatase [Frankia sp. AgB1.9]MBL7619874.1 serine/threonine-protein phosphatase [Frankia sp. AgB1.8]